MAECASLLALQPSVVQQLVYGYRAEASAEARLATVSLYLARGGRSSGQADARCHGDIACQQSANALMEAAVTQVSRQPGRRATRTPGYPETRAGYRRQGHRRRVLTVGRSSDLPTVRRPTIHCGH